MADYVSLLNQLLQSRGHLNPADVLHEAYRGMRGEHHTPSWTVVLEVREPGAVVQRATGLAANVKEARKEACKQLYKVMQNVPARTGVPPPTLLRAWDLDDEVGGKFLGARCAGAAARPRVLCRCQISVRAGQGERTTCR